MTRSRKETSARARMSILLLVVAADWMLEPFAFWAAVGEEGRWDLGVR